MLFIEYKEVTRKDRNVRNKILSHKSYTVLRGCSKDGCQALSTFLHTLLFPVLWRNSELRQKEGNAL